MTQVWLCKQIMLCLKIPQWKGLVVVVTICLCKSNQHTRETHRCLTGANLNWADTVHEVGCSRSTEKRTAISYYNAKPNKSHARLTYFISTQDQASLTTTDRSRCYLDKAQIIVNWAHETNKLVRLSWMKSEGIACGAVFIPKELTHKIGHHSALQHRGSKTLMTHLSQSCWQPKHCTTDWPKIGDEMHNSPLQSSCKTQQTPKQFWSLLFVKWRQAGAKCLLR